MVFGVNGLIWVIAPESVGVVLRSSLDHVTVLMPAVVGVPVLDLVYKG